jgi:histidine ammonia-lyase
MKKKVSKTLFIDGENFSLEQLNTVSTNPDIPIKISEKAKTRMRKSREWVDKVQREGSPVVYGINTGFGSKANVSISKEKLKDLQRNLIMSHSTGMGEPLPLAVVRAAMLMRANTLAKGYSGVRVELVETILKMLEKGVIPWIPEQGSLGASGDLAPLSHLALVISKGVVRDLEEDSGKAFYYNSTSNKWEIISGIAAMKKAGIPRLVLEAKEGLALNNGTQISTAILAIALNEAQQLVKQADIAMAMTFESLEGISRSFRKEIHELRPQPGQLETAENILRLIEGSQFVDRYPEKVQDAYCLRCHPQVMAGVRSTLEFVEKVVNTEINSTTDNPIIFPDLKEENKAISGGNFHAQPIAFAGDFLSIVLCEIANISERRIFRLSDRTLNCGLPSFLIENGGLESGLMLAQYTAAAIVSENKTLAHPASIDSIPTCENQEDHVSMAPIAARKATQILENVKKVVALEFLFAAQALDLRIKQEKKSTPLSKMGKGTRQAYQLIRKSVPFLKEDRTLYPLINTVLELVKSKEILRAVENKIGKLK